MRCLWLGGFIFVALLACGIVGRNGQTLAALSPDDVRLPTIEFTLKNGMQFLVVERHESPAFSAYLRFKVGSANEVPGQTGLAHLLEHMMFKGTRLFGTRDPEREAPILEKIEARHTALRAEQAKRNLPGGRVDAAAVAALENEIADLEAQAKSLIVRNELWEIYQENGAVQLNATTSREGTQYFVSLPKNRLELWALLESDRMRDPVFREFYTERSVVQEERRQRVDTNPRGQLFEAALAQAFVTLPYRHPVLGWPGDLEQLSRSQAEEYFRTYYAPNNALAVLVGDLDPAEVRRTIEAYFGTLPPGPTPPPLFGAEPPQLGERRIRVEFPAEPQLLMLYHAPALAHEDAPALTVLGALLGEGRSSRLYRRLVDEKRLVTGISAGPWLLRETGVFIIQATPRAPHTLEEVERAIDEEVASATTEPPTPRDLLKVRNGIEATTIRGLVSNEGLAAQLGNAWALTGDWNFPFAMRRRIQAVTADEVLAVAKRYLVRRDRTVAWLVPSGESAPARPRGAGDFAPTRENP